MPALIGSVASQVARPSRRASTASGRLGSRARRDVWIVSVGGQLERVIGVATALGLRWGLDPARLGIYSGLRLFLDNTNRSSLGVGLGAVQRIPILRAAGQSAEADRLANVAHTVNLVTCSVYAVGLIVLAGWITLAGGRGALGHEWALGLVCTAGLVVLKRHESFLVAMLRAHQEFRLSTGADVVESVLTALGVVTGLWFLGLWGLLAALGLGLAGKIAYLHWNHPWRFRWDWDVPTALGLVWTGLPILLNTVAFGCIVGLDRTVILATFVEPEHAVGLYSVALLGTSWCLDLAGRVVLVLYSHFQLAHGRNEAPATVARQAIWATEAQGLVLAPLAAAAYLVGPSLLAWLVPRYAEGIPAFRPLLPAVLLLSLAWPVRQYLIAVGRSRRLLAATLGALGVAVPAVLLGGTRGGLVGVGQGMSVAGLAVLVLTTATAYVPVLGWLAWSGHLARLALVVAGFSAAACAIDRVPLPTTLHPVVVQGVRLLALGVCTLSALSVPRLRHRLTRQGVVPGESGVPHRPAWPEGDRRP